MVSPVSTETPQASYNEWFRWLRACLVVMALGVHGGYVAYVRLNPGQGFEHPNLIQSEPYSDAWCWDEIASELAAGHGQPLWPGRRPLYGWLLGSLYLFTGGPHYNLALAVNVVLLALSVGLVFTLFSRELGLVVALVSTLAMIISREALSCSAQTLTEPLGIFLLVWHFAELIWAIEEQDLRRMGLSGVLLALSNAARPLTLPAAVGYLPLVVILWRRGGASTRQALLASVSLLVPTAVVVLAFMSWNQYQNGIFTLSDNTAGDLYAVTEPRYGAWVPEVDNEAHQAGQYTVADRYHYFLRKAKDNLRNRPEVFLGRVKENLVVALRLEEARFFEGWLYWLWIGGVLVVLLAAGSISSRLAGCLALFIVLPLVAQLHGHWLLLPVSLVVALVQIHRPLVCLLACLVCCSLGAVALFGSVMLRLHLMVEWAMVGVLLASLQLTLPAIGRPLAWVLHRLAASGSVATTPNPMLADTPPGEADWLRRLSPHCAWTFLVVATAGIVLLGLRNGVWPPPATEVVPATSDDAQAILAPVAADHPEIFTEPEQIRLRPGSLLALNFDPKHAPRVPGGVTAMAGRVDPHVYYFPTGAWTHFTGMKCTARSYDYSILRVRIDSPNSQIVMWREVAWPGDCRGWAGQDLLLALRDVVFPSGEHRGEGIAACPWNRRTGEVERNAMLSAATNEAHCRRMASLLTPGPADAAPPTLETAPANSNDPDP